MVNQALFYKLMRTIWNTRGQFISLGLVVSLGIMTYICMSATYFNLENNMARFYRECNFADYYFQVASAPEQIINQIRTVPGVAAVNGRVIKDIKVIKRKQEQATVRIVGYPVNAGTVINRLHLYGGRMFEDDSFSNGMETILDPQFSEVNRLTTGSEIMVVANGKEVPLTVRGTATTPEFSYPVKNITTMLNDPTSFGVAIIPQYQAQKLLNMGGQINSIIIKIAPGSNERYIKEEIKAILKPYGYQGDYPKKDQNSNSFLRDQLRQLRAETRVIPTIFLLAAIAIQFVMLGRMIKSQRLQIGIMKALGYKSNQIIWHYTSYALIIGLSGTLIWILAGLFLSEYLTDLYLSFYNLPHYTNKISGEVILISLMLGIGVGLLSGWLAARRIVFINPSESMRPEPPIQGRKIFFENWTALWSRINSSWKMSLRGIGRHPTRFWVTVMGVAFAAALLVVSMFFHDSIGYIEKKAYYIDQKFDLLAQFNTPQDINNSDLITGIKGVILTEPIIEVPIKISRDQKSSNVILQGFPADSRMKTVEGTHGQSLPIPTEGIIVGLKTAEKLNIQVGDLVKIETELGIGSNQESVIRVVGISRQVAGKNSFASIATVNDLLREHNLITGVMMKVDPVFSQAAEVELIEMPGVADILSREKEVENFNRNMDSLEVAMQVLTLFAIMLGCAISYNSSVISFGERLREFATLRVIGMKNSEIAGILGKETILQGVLGLCLGLPLGRLLAGGVAGMVSSEVYEFRAIVYPETYLTSILLTAFFVLAGYLIAIRGISRLNHLEILKNRD
ncbi:MAG TPA: FtsX-like permease family protein [Syntrophomonadaceae bacterium]|nr:FtsX-like permease family protein [Syntrophomonadaceae bacterium]